MDIWHKSYYSCDCGTEAILISNDEQCKQIDFAIFSYGSYANDTLRFRDKLTYIWSLLKTGKPYHDNICLSYEKAKKLGEDLIELTKEKK